HRAVSRYKKSNYARSLDKNHFSSSNQEEQTLQRNFVPNRSPENVRDISLKVQSAPTRCLNDRKIGILNSTPKTTYLRLKTPSSAKSAGFQWLKTLMWRNSVDSWKYS